MCDLFTDKDLFVDGLCECVEENGEQFTQCDENTYSPTSIPTESPSFSPTKNPTTSPTSVPSEAPSSMPSDAPSDIPTADLPDDGVLVANLFGPESHIENFGCLWPGNLHRTFNGNTNRYNCERTGLTNVPAGIIIGPEPGAYVGLTIIKGFRVYAPSNCKACDVVSYIMEGRISPESPWVEMHRGDLPWKGLSFNDDALDRNPEGLTITSTYAGADPNLVSTEVWFHGHSGAFLEYKLTFDTRTPGNNRMGWAALELPGMVIPPEPSAHPTLSLRGAQPLLRLVGQRSLLPQVQLYRRLIRQVKF